MKRSLAGILACLASNAQGADGHPFNVKNFGAAGDGQRTDAGAIDKAIQPASDARRPYRRGFTG
jgi:polygalacturonase